MPLVKWSEGQYWFSSNEYRRLELLRDKITHTREFTNAYKPVPVVLQEYAEDLPPGPVFRPIHIGSRSTIYPTQTQTQASTSKSHD